MAAGNHSLGTIRGTIEIDYDGAGIVRAIRDTDKAKNSLSKIDGASNKVLSSFAKFTSGALKLGGAINLVNNSLSLVAGTLAVVGPLAAAGFAAAPGAILGVAAALTVAKLATSGLGDAFAAAGEKQAKFDKAIEKLSPKAKELAIAFRKAYPQIKAVQASIQDAFVGRAASQIGTVVKAIQSLQVNATGVARAMGLVVQNVVKFATSQKSLAGINSILAGVRSFLYQITSSIGPLVQAFIVLGAQVSGFGDTLGGVVANALARFTTFLKEVNVKEVFATALPIIKSLGQFLGDVAAIAGQLFSLFTVDGAGAAGILASMASELRAFLESASGQEALTALRTAIEAIGGAAGQVFLALLQALAPILVALAPGITILANQMASVLVPAINALNPLLVSLATFLSENMTWIGPLAGAVVAAAAAYKIYAAAALAVTTVQRLLSANLIASVAAWVASTAAMVANRIAMVATTVASAAVRAATIAWTAVQWALNAALSANPIGLVIIAIAALVAAIIYAWKNSETFRNIVLAAWAGIKTAASSLWNFLKMVFNDIASNFTTSVNQIKGAATAVWSAIVTVVRGYLNIYRSVVAAVTSFVKTAWSTSLSTVRAVTSAVWSAIVGVITGAINRVKAVIAGVKVVVTIVRNAFNQAKSAAVSAIGGLISAVAGIRNRVTGALGNLGSLLYSKGQQLIRGFISGIGSMIGAVKSKVSSVVSAVTRFLPGSPAKEGPLSGRGYVLLRARRFMDDFAQGLEDGSQKPSAALLGAVAPVARAVVPAVSGARSLASTTPTPAVSGGTRSYSINIGEKAFAELVVDAVTGAPVAVKKAVDEGTRLTGYAGSGR